MWQSGVLPGTSVSITKNYLRRKVRAIIQQNFHINSYKQTHVRKEYNRISILTLTKHLGEFTDQLLHRHTRRKRKKCILD